MTDVSKRKVLFILSPGYTGSTLLTLLIATHPEVATIGERRNLHVRLNVGRSKQVHCLCGRYARDCDVLSAAYAAGRRKLPFYLRGVNYPKFKLSRHQHVNRIAFRLARATELGYRQWFLTRWMSFLYRRVCDANAAVVDFVLQNQGANVLVDSSKVPGDLKHLKDSGLFDVRVIHLSRDGRGRFYSLLDRDPSLSTEDAARDVRDAHRRIQTLLDEWEDPVTHVKYEDLCRRPLDEIRRIAVEAGLDPEGMSLDYLATTKHLLGNARIVQSESDQIVNQELWRTSLSPEALETFERIAGESNRTFGYID